MSPILVTLTLRRASDFEFERSYISFKENKPDGVDPNYNGLPTVFEWKNEKLFSFRQTDLLKYVN